MADQPLDIYAPSRQSLRETVKWYVAALTGIGAVLAGGVSFAIIPDLRGPYLWAGLALGIATLAGVLLALWRVQTLLFVRPFGETRMTEPAIAAGLKPYLPTLLPGGITDWKGLTRKLANEKAKTPANADEIARLERLKAKITGFAAFQDLERQVRRANAELLVLFLLVCIGLALLTFLHARAKAASAEADAVAIRFDPGADWSGYVTGLARNCASATQGGFAAKGVPDKPFPGWWRITLDGPACHGVVLSVPEATVSPRQGSGAPDF